MRYDPRTFRGLTFHDALPAFREGSDTPRAWLERCLEVIEAREPAVQALAATDIEGARQAAAASTERWQAGRPLSPIDGMPVGIKDLLETRTMPTEMGCEAYRGNFPKRDNAAVAALREAGAVVLAKTVTSELGGAHPGPTTNPFDPARTPGGSSSGSAAAVAAGMLPAAIGSQAGGSIVRPAGYCGNVALKPSRGAINRGERQTSSQSCHGVHANSIEDMWRTAAEIAKRAGGDPGHRGLAGPAGPPPAEKPRRLVAIEGAGWSTIDGATGAAFHRLLEAVEAAGVAVLRPEDDPALAALDAELMQAQAVCYAVIGWENRWLHRALADMGPDAISFRARDSLERAEAMTVADYHCRARRTRGGAGGVGPRARNGRWRAYAKLPRPGAPLGGRQARRAAPGAADGRCGVQRARLDPVRARRLDAVDGGGRPAGRRAGDGRGGRGCARDRLRPLDAGGGGAGRRRLERRKETRP